MHILLGLETFMFFANMRAYSISSALSTMWGLESLNIVTFFEILSL